MKKLVIDWLEDLQRRAPESIGALLHFKVHEIDMEAGAFSFNVETASWMQNAFGTLHGGIAATMLDQGMGMLATCIMDGKGLTPSIQLNISYHRPLVPGKQVRLNVYVESVTKTLIHMRGEAMHLDQLDKRCVSATGIFFFKPFES